MMPFVSLQSTLTDVSIWSRAIAYLSFVQYFSTSSFTVVLLSFRDISQIRQKNVELQPEKPKEMFPPRLSNVTLTIVPEKNY